MRRLLACVLACSVALPTRAQELTELEKDTEQTHDLAFADISDPNPGSGRGQIIAGWIATGIGIAGVAQAPLCEVNDFDRGRSLRRCRNLGIAFGVIGLTFGVPWLVFGYQRRAAQKAWKKRHGLSQLPDLNVSFGGDSLLLDLRF